MNKSLWIIRIHHIFFSLPTQEFFRGQGKIKVGTSWTYARPLFPFFLSVFPEPEDSSLTFSS